MGIRQSLCVALGVFAGCSGPSDVPEKPTWADIQPILSGSCNHCHGSTAAVTGSQGPAVYRFDFFDLADGSCGEAAAAIDLPAMALASASRMKDSIASINGVRPRMPPAPAPLLSDWERDTLDKWSRAREPIKGAAPRNNRLPGLQVLKFPAKADGTVAFTVILDDPDGDSVIGVIKGGDTLVKLDRSGAFSVSVDSTGWTNGRQKLTAVLCDGWANASYDVGEVEIAHARAF